MKSHKSQQKLTKKDTANEPVVRYTVSSPQRKLSPKTPPNTTAGYMTSEEFRSSVKSELKAFYLKNGLL